MYLSAIMLAANHAVVVAPSSLTQP
jgi:hypothetical protein